MAISSETSVYQGCIYTSLHYPVRNHCACIQTTNICIHPVVSSAAVRIVSEQPKTYIQDCQLEQPRKNMPATKGIFQEVT